MIIKKIPQLHPFANEVLPDLWVGDWTCCKRARKYDFKTVCVLEKPCVHCGECTWNQVLAYDKRHLKHEILQTKEEITKEEYRAMIHVKGEFMIKAMDTIKAYWEEGPVLVHCAAGVERSPLTVACFIQREFDLPFDQCYGWVKTHRPHTQDRKMWLPEGWPN